MSDMREVVLARLHTIYRTDREVSYHAYNVEAWAGYGVVCPGRVTTNGSIAMAVESCGRAFWHEESSFYVMRFESCHPLVPAYPNALIDVWQGFVDAYVAEFPAEAKWLRPMAERRAAAKKYLAKFYPAASVE